MESLDVRRRRPAASRSSEPDRTATSARSIEPPAGPAARGRWSAVAHRCPCGQPDVVETSPRLDDGTPFPTLYYLTCPRATAAASRLESAGLMREWQDELATDAELAARLPRRARGLPRHPRRPRRAAHPGDRRRDARPGQVPARAGRARARRRAGRQPDRRPRGRRDGGVVGGRARARQAARTSCVTRVAAIDCGTNSIRLLVADVPADGAHTDLVRRMEVVRLGQGVDATGRLAPEAIERTRRVSPSTPPRPATSARRRCGWWPPAPPATPPTARSSRTWCRHARPGARGGHRRGGGRAVLPRRDRSAAAAAHGSAPPRPPFLVVDIGGGSTEFVLGDADGVRAARSVDIGCVRLTERHLHDDPPTAEQIAPGRGRHPGRPGRGRRRGAGGRGRHAWWGWPAR